jgi:hypothetical protein
MRPTRLISMAMQKKCAWGTDAPQMWYTASHTAKRRNAPIKTLARRDVDRVCCT